MKTVFINAKYAGKIDLEKIGKLPKKVGLVASIQFVSLLKDVEKYLAKQGIKTLISPGNQKNLGQILGCNASAAVDLKEKVEAFLYIGDGRFHPIAVGMKT
ncbi:MAG: 2-(3-amino-3-carboxypropyl)histidine synthase subunit, partial [Nanoarchaeota archaeon]|nr:2-(3-amino-3-carboxypropyl)histidine synthase subunit [Nanoarchaeota archaeon]